MNGREKKGDLPAFLSSHFFPLLPPCFYSFGSGITVIPTDTKCNYLNDGTTGQILFSDYAFLRIENGGQRARPPFFSSVLSTCETVWSFSFFLSFFFFRFVEYWKGKWGEKRKKEERREEWKSVKLSRFSRLQSEISRNWKDLLGTLLDADNLNVKRVKKIEYAIVDWQL